MSMSEEDYVFDLNSIELQKPYYFDCFNDNLLHLKLLEKKDKSSCYLTYKNSLCIGFKITNNPKVNIYCEFTFYLSSKTGKYLPRPIFKKMSNELKEKEVQTEKIIIDFKNSDDAENFWKIIEFFYKYKKLVDLNEFHEFYVPLDKHKYLIECETEEHADKIKRIQQFILNTNLSDQDIQSILKSNKLRNLKIFDDLLKKNLNYLDYRQQHDNVKGQSEEAVWQHFLSTNDWILGLNVDIRFLQELIPEAHIGISDIRGQGSSKADILAIHDYTVLIELKKPSTKIFTDRKSDTARAGTWSFSRDFIDGISQCLAQKNQWLKSFDKKSNNIALNNGVSINTIRNIDPKVIFIIGNKREEFPQDYPNQNIFSKRDTFESFRRNSRNVDIITYDELYERAFAIVHGKSH